MRRCQMNARTNTHDLVNEDRQQDELPYCKGNCAIKEIRKADGRN